MKFDLTIGFKRICRMKITTNYKIVIYIVIYIDFIYLANGFEIPAKVNVTQNCIARHMDQSGGESEAQYKTNFI